MRARSDLKISGGKTVVDWKIVKKELVLGGTENAWKKVYEDFFLKRLETRYFVPIKQLQKFGDEQGEGFSIVALQCSLVEFLASTLEGKNYKYCPSHAVNTCGEYEYFDSKALFIHFLCSEHPFRQYFNNSTEARDFYGNVRCALLHEARTKGGWRILAGCNCDPPVDVEEKIVYRNSLQSAFNDFVARFGKNLIHCDRLQEAFIRKFDSLCEE